MVLRSKKWSQNELARALNARSGDVNRWLWCVVRPGRDWCVAIERMLGIPVAAWTRPPTKPLPEV